MRTATISCAIACGAMIAGPGVVGAAVASADLFGIDVDILDIFDDDDRRKRSHKGPPKVSVSGDVKKSRGDQSSTFGGGIGAELGGVGAAGGGGGGGAAPSSGNVGRSPKLPPVPTAPSTRSIVIRAPEAPAAPVPVAPVAPLPVVPPVVLPPVPVVVPLAPAPPGAPGPAAPQAPAAPAAPTIQEPGTNRQPAPPESAGPHTLPESFRAGYADYLRMADVTDLMWAALPGTVGIMAITAAGGVVGYRQARAATVLPPAGIARFLE